MKAEVTDFPMRLITTVGVRFHTHTQSDHREKLASSWCWESSPVAMVTVLFVHSAREWDGPQL